MNFDREKAKAFAEKYLTDGAAVRLEAAISCTDSIIAAAELIAKSMSQGNKLLLCGNGGSAADCQHMATEFVSRLTKDFERPAMAAIALTTDTSFLTAYGNDCGFEGIFERQVQALGKPGDVLFGISTSGNSENVVLAVNAAKKIGMSVVILCGQGGKLAPLADVAVSVPCPNNQLVQEMHLAIEHIICYHVERAIHS